VWSRGKGAWGKKNAGGNIGIALKVRRLEVREEVTPADKRPFKEAGGTKFGDERAPPHGALRFNHRGRDRLSLMMEGGKGEVRYQERSAQREEEREGGSSPQQGANDSRGRR